MLQKGDKFIVIRPDDEFQRERWPMWLTQMDSLDGCILTVDSIELSTEEGIFVNDEDRELLISSGLWLFRPEWCKKI